VNRFVVALFVLAISLAGLVPRQESVPDAPKKAAVIANDKFSGTVTALSPDSVTVVRAVPARDAVTRKFLLDAQTKVEGKLRIKARVTVQYSVEDEGQFRAVHIIVR
jgi:Domain of unknown function (DUF5666)